MTTQDLAVEHMALAGRIAGNILKRLPRRPYGYMDAQDVYQEARLGLVQAATRFDGRRHVEFGAYARRRIDGAVLDGLRRNDHLKRCVRAKVKAGDAADQAPPLPLLFPDEMRSRFAGPDEDAAQAETARIVRDAIDALPPRLGAVIECRYLGGETMREIGERLGVNESRACQLHQNALAHLRRYFQRHDLTTRSFR